jgi:hypothetical protein
MSSIKTMPAVSGDHLYLLIVSMALRKEPEDKFGSRTKFYWRIKLQDLDQIYSRKKSLN